MARITSYPVLSTVSSGDWIPITDTSVTGNPLKNVTVGDLQSFIIQGSTLQSVVTAGNTYQGSSGPLWTWSDAGLIAASATLSTTLSERSFRVTNLSDSSYAEITPAQVTMASASGNKTGVVPNVSLVSNVTLQMPLASGTLALTTDIPASPWVPVTGGINYPTNRVGVNTALPQEALDVTGNIRVSGKIEAPNLYGQLNGTISSSTTGTTQASIDDSTKIATTAFVNNAVSAIPSGLTFQGNWDALNNVPDLSALTPDNGDFWIVSVAGTTNLGGITDWQVGDWAISVVSGGVQTWQKIDNSSVLTGAGTGQKIAKWDGSGSSLTLADSLIAESGSNVGIGTATPSYPLTVITEGTAAGFDINLWSEIEKTGASTGSAYGGFFSSKGDSSGALANVVGSRNYAKDDGLGDTDFIVGASHFAIANGGGASAGVYGVNTKAQSTGTATQDIDYLIGSNISAELNNPNASARYLQGSHNTIKLGDGDVTDNAMALILDFDYTGTGVITGDFEYLRIQNDTLPVVSGTSRAINSISVLPSVFAGSLESTGFIKTGGAATEFLMADGTVTTGSLVGSIPTEQIAFGNAGGDGITSSASFAFNDTSKQLFVGGTSPFGSAKITEEQVQIQFDATLSAALALRNSIPEVRFTKGNINTYLQVATTPTQQNFISLPDKSGTVALLDDVSSGTVTGTGGAGYIPLWAGASELTNSAVFQDGTSVGIGTITPGAQLETTENILVKGMTVGVGAYVPPPQVTGGTTVIGVDALPTTTGGVRNTAIGHSTLKSLTTGSNNTAVGSQAMENVTQVTNTVAVGYLALNDGITPYSTVAVGAEALRYSTLSSGTVAVGTKAGRLDSTNANVTRADQSIFIGQETKPLGNNESNQIVIGNSAVGLGSNTVVLGKAATTKTRLYGNVGIGTDTPGAQLETTEGIIVQGMNISAPQGQTFKNTAVGYQTMQSNTTGVSNTAIGYQALISNSDGDENVAIGSGAMVFNSSGGDNIAIGKSALNNNTAGNQNIAIGTDALRSNSTSGSLAIGHEALYANTTGSANIALGNSALRANTTGIHNIVVGRSAGRSIVDGSNNTLVGYRSGFSNISGLSNTYIGEDTGLSALGSENSAVGRQALSQLSSGDGNTALGYNSGTFISGGTGNTSATDSIFIGKNAKALSIGETNQIVIGSDAIGLGSNTAVIGTPSITETRLHGDINVANGDVEIAIGQGVILVSPNGTKYRITVADNGTLGTTLVP